MRVWKKRLEHQAHSRSDIRGGCGLPVATRAEIIIRLSSPLTMLLLRHTRRREFITLLGGAAACPLAARAQQAERIRHVGVLAGHEKYLPEFHGLREQLRELGYIEGKNLAIDWRYADQGPASLPGISSICIPTFSFPSQRPRRRR